MPSLSIPVRPCPPLSVAAASPVCYAVLGRVILRRPIAPEQSTRPIWESRQKRQPPPPQNANRGKNGNLSLPSPRRERGRGEVVYETAAIIGSSTCIRSFTWKGLASIPS